MDEFTINTDEFTKVLNNSEESYVNESQPITAHVAVTTTKKEKRPKAKIPVGTLAVFLVICVIVSTLSGAFSSLFMFTIITKTSVESSASSKEEFVIDETTDYSDENDVLQNEQETEQVFVPEAEIEAETLPPPLTKGDIYADAVNSIFAIRSTWREYYNSFFGSYYKDAYCTGTGFAVTSSGYIVTNYHVIESAENITVTDYNGNEYAATVVGSEPTNDFAVIKINNITIPVTMGSSSALKVGDDIMVIGNALGELSYTFTDGIVSHLSRNVKVESGEIINMFQTNAAINNGNSGGPVYNMDGEVVGIASAKYASDKIEGLGFCIPIDDVKNMLSDIIVFGHVTGKASLGVSLQTVTSSMASRYSLPSGCYVVAIDSDSSAYYAGLRKGDVITKLGQTEISSCDDVKLIINNASSGEQMKITFSRKSEKKSITVLLDEYKPSSPRTNYSNVYDF